MVPTACDIIRTIEDGDTLPTTKDSTKMENENGNGHVSMMLDVAKLNSEQRVVVQLGGVGLIGSEVSDFQQVRLHGCYCFPCFKSISSLHDAEQVPVASWIILKKPRGGKVMPESPLRTRCIGPVRRSDDSRLELNA